MSKILSLSKTYGAFFLGCTKFAVSPYTNTFNTLAKSIAEDGHSDFTSIAGASIVTGILTFVVPILPMLTAVTFALASIALLAAVASTFLCYPVAALSDACTPSDDRQMHYR